MYNIKGGIRRNNKQKKYEIGFSNALEKVSTSFVEEIRIHTSIDKINLIIKVPQQNKIEFLKKMNLLLSGSWSFDQ